MTRFRQQACGTICCVLLITVLSGCQGHRDERIKALEQEVDRLRREQQYAQQTPTLPGTISWKPIRGGAALTVDGNSLFYPGQARIKDTGKQILARVAADIHTGFEDRDIYVLGHTDDDPIQKTTWLDNRELSAARAVAIVRVLESHGLRPERLIACGCGEHRPVAPNSTPEGKARNRRIEILALEPLVASSPSWPP